MSYALKQEKNPALLEGSLKLRLIETYDTAEINLNGLHVLSLTSIRFQNYSN